MKEIHSNSKVVREADQFLMFSDPNVLMKCIPHVIRTILKTNEYIVNELKVLKFQMKNILNPEDEINCDELKKSKKKKKKQPILHL